MTVMMQMLSVSKETFSLLSMSKMAAVGMDIKVYRHSLALKGGFFQVKYLYNLFSSKNIFLFS